MLAILIFLNAHNFLIFQPILMTLVSKFIVQRALSDLIHLLLGLRSPLSKLSIQKPLRITKGNNSNSICP